MRRGSAQIIALPDGTEIEPIRIETALSRFPIHNLAKSEQIEIFLQNQGEAVRWLIAPNSTYGHPGPLAYKIDTLVINRRIDEARNFGQAFPEILRLGSLHEIADEIGSESKTNYVKTALLQNASAFITAKIEYTLKDGTKKFLDANFTRYQVIFTGENMPDGRRADAVYIVLNPVFREVVSSAQARPVDYKYLSNLKPLSQRFYELVSPDIYGAVRHRTFTNIRYSDFCLLGPATRQGEQWQVKRQLDPVIAPHLASGYISQVHYQPFVDEQRKPDWYISLTPGPLAYGQAEAFNSKRSQRKSITAGDPRQPTLPIPMPPPNRRKVGSAAAPLPPENAALVAELTAQGMNTADAQRLATEKPEECRRQLEFLPFHGKPRSKGAFLRRAIEQGFGAPEAYGKAQAQAEAERRRQDAAALRHSHKIALEAQRAADEAKVDELLNQLEMGNPEAFQAFTVFVETERDRIQKRYSGMHERIKTRMLEQLETDEKRRELFLLWQAEQESVASNKAFSFIDAANLERRHVSAPAFKQVSVECETYNAQRAASQPELMAVVLLDEWVQAVRANGTRIADADKSFADFALERLYRDA